MEKALSSTAFHEYREKFQQKGFTFSVRRYLALQPRSSRLLVYSSSYIDADNEIKLGSCRNSCHAVQILGYQ